MLNNKKDIIMVREEYLNPEFMYKLINSLCKADGWRMYFFVFGKLTYRDFKQPILMQNNHGYNMVYKFQVYKLRENVNLGRSVSYHKRGSSRYKDVVSVSSSDFMENIICKDIYFDILNECFVEHDDTVLSFEEFPSFFRLDNQLYYGIYGQPKVLKHHYSKARDCYNQESYMRTMEINSHNLFDPHSLLCNMIDENRQIYDFYSDKMWEYWFETQEEAVSTIKGILGRDYEPDECKKFYRIGENFNTRCHASDGYFKLYIHRPKFPVFYTDNVLELTIPIAESVIDLGHRVSHTLYSIHETLTLLTRSVAGLMNDRLCDQYKSAYDAKLEWWMMNGKVGDWLCDFHGIIANCHRVAERATYEDRVRYGEIADTTERSRLRALENISRIERSYETLYSNIKKIKASEFSLNALLEISNGFKMLESKNSAEK